MSPFARRIANLLGFALVIALNTLANTLPINGQTTGEVSAKYPSLFTPAGFTFSIWGVIYLLLLGFVVYQLLPSQRRNLLINRITPWFLLTCLANASWMVAWHYEWITLSLLLMLALLGGLIAIFRLIDPLPRRSLGDRLWMHLPFSVYAGWVTVAAIANLSALQTALGWNDLALGAVQWTLLKLAVAGSVAAWVALRRGNAVFVLAVAWAAYGISRGQAAAPEVAGAAGMLVLVAVALAVLALFGRRPAGLR